VRRQSTNLYSCLSSCKQSLLCKFFAVSFCYKGCLGTLWWCKKDYKHVYMVTRIKAIYRWLFWDMYINKP
jgi:hypothetical protein